MLGARCWMLDTRHHLGSSIYSSGVVSQSYSEPTIVAAPITSIATNMPLLPAYMNNRLETMTTMPNATNSGRMVGVGIGMPSSSAHLRPVSMCAEELGI